LSELSVRGADSTAHSFGSLRGRTLRRLLERAGLEQVTQRTTIIERWAPLAAVERRFWGNWLSFLADLAIGRGVPTEDVAAWSRMVNPCDPSNPINDPEFYACEGQVVAVGVRGRCA
jgi:hypothetical protein